MTKRLPLLRTNSAQAALPMTIDRLVLPVTLCHHEATFDLPQDDRPDRGIDVACGQTNIAGRLIASGWRSIGVDFAPESNEAVRPEPALEITADRMKAIQGDVLHLQMGRWPVPA